MKLLFVVVSKPYYISYSLSLLFFPQALDYSRRIRIKICVTFSEGIFPLRSDLQFLQTRPSNAVLSSNWFLCPLSPTCKECITCFVDTLPPKIHFLITLCTRDKSYYIGERYTRGYEEPGRVPTMVITLHRRLSFVHSNKVEYLSFIVKSWEMYRLRYERKCGRTEVQDSRFKGSATERICAFIFSFNSLQKIL